MGPLTLVAFFIACLFGIGYPAIAACLCLGLFPIKQLLQASSGFFRDSLTGSQLINFLIGGVALVAVGRRVVAKSDQFRGYVTSSFILTMLLYVWGVVTCWWSLASAEGFASFTTNIPYIALYLLILPTLVVTMDDWCRVASVWLIMNTIVTALILVNPEFTTWAGRLVLNLGVAGLKVTKTNPSRSAPPAASASSLGCSMRAPRARRSSWCSDSSPCCWARRSWCGREAEDSSSSRSSPPSWRIRWRER